VHEPQGAAKRHLPVGHALEIPAELGLPQLGIAREDCGSGQPLVDELSRFDGASQRAVDDPANVLIAQSLADGRRLHATQRAEIKAVEVAVQQLVRVFHVGVPDHVNARGGH
jgi:hypothetical protein